MSISNLSLNDFLIKTINICDMDARQYIKEPLLKEEKPKAALKGNASIKNTYEIKKIDFDYFKEE